MRILADENCDSILVAALTADRHDVRRIVDLGQGVDDRQVFDEAIRDARVLLTHDLDFGLISDSSIEKPPAVVLMRLEPLKAALRAEIVVNFFRSMEETCRGKLYVVEPGSVRVRLLQTQD